MDKCISEIADFHLDICTILQLLLISFPLSGIIASTCVFSSLSYSISFHISIPLSFTLSTHNCFEEPPAGTVINSPSCGDPINKLCTLFCCPVVMMITHQVLAHFTRPLENSTTFIHMQSYAHKNIDYHFSTSLTIVTVSFCHLTTALFLHLN